MTNASILIDGRLVADPELKFTQSGAPVCNFRIARSDSEKLPDGSWGENRNQLFLTVNVWRELGEECAATLTKGANVCLIGKLVTRQWETKEGQKRSAVEMNAFSVFLQVQPPHKGGFSSPSPPEDPWGGQQQQQHQSQQQAGGWSAPAQTGQAQGQGNEKPPF